MNRLHWTNSETIKNNKVLSKFDESLTPLIFNFSLNLVVFIFSSFKLAHVLVRLVLRIEDELACEAHKFTWLTSISNSCGFWIWDSVIGRWAGGGGVGADYRNNLLTANYVSSDLNCKHMIFSDDIFCRYHQLLRKARNTTASTSTKAIASTKN